MFYHWPRDHEDYLIDNDRILDLVAVAGTISIFLQGPVIGPTKVLVEAMLQLKFSLSLFESC